MGGPSLLMSEAFEGGLPGRKGVDAGDSFEAGRLRKAGIRLPCCSLSLLRLCIVGRRVEGWQGNRAGSWRVRGLWLPRPRAQRACAAWSAARANLLHAALRQACPSSPGGLRAAAQGVWRSRT